MSLLLLFIVISSFVSICCVHWHLPVKNSIKGKCMEFIHSCTKTALKNSANCYRLQETRNKYKCTQSFADNYSCGEFPRGRILVSEVADPCGKPLYECTGLCSNYANLIPSHVDVCVFRHLCFLSLLSTDDPFCHCFDRNKILMLQLSRSW